MVRLLCTGDMHLGRMPSRVDPDETALTVETAWQRFVQTAIDKKVDAVILTGDTVDQDNKMFEAMHWLEVGVGELAEKGIDVIAVAGNHDYDAFPDLVRKLGEEAPLRFIGAGGRWETNILERDGAPALRLVGWSFPEQFVDTSPLNALVLDEEAIPTIGLLHCDLLNARSRHAPVVREELARAGVNAWLLGHIHAADAHYADDGQLQLYPGSLQPLHFNEPGCHGAWMVEVDSDGRARAELIPLASLRYEPLHVSVEGCDTVENVQDHVVESVRENLCAAVDEMPHLHTLVCRLIFTGRTPLSRKVEQWAREELGDFKPAYKDAVAVIDDFRLETQPAHDLRELSKTNDPSSVLASLLLAIERGESIETTEAVRRRAHEELKRVRRMSRFEPLLERSLEEAEDDHVEAMVHSRGLLLLDEMLEERERRHV